MNLYLIHYETREGGHQWAVVEMAATPRAPYDVTWFAVYAVPTASAMMANMSSDPVSVLKQWARGGELART